MPQSRLSQIALTQKRTALPYAAISVKPNCADAKTNRLAVCRNFSASMHGVRLQPHTYVNGRTDAKTAIRTALFYTVCTQIHLFTDRFRDKTITAH